MMTSGQRLALEQLNEIATYAVGTLEVLGTGASTSGGPITVEVSISCAGVPRKAGGLPLRERERFRISIPPDFPFRKPAVATSHSRFAGFAHVQWKRELCLYQAPSEWVSTNGMYGFIDRLDTWLRQGAIGQLDPVGGPLHPPVAYVTGTHRVVIPRVNTPSVGDAPWFGTVKLLVDTPHRVDLGEWHPIEDPTPPIGSSSCHSLAPAVSVRISANIS